MIHGNTFAQQTLRTIVQSLDAGEKNKPIFLLLTWPQNIGKTTFVQELMQEVLGMFYMQDFLFVQDMTSKLGKPHTLKVGKMDAESETMTFDDETEYTDTTMREIVTWLQYSSAWSKKVVLLENIERMNLSSANAFLKAAEEPLSGRIIIATTTHPAQIMETIVSRAIVVPFQALTDIQMQEYVTAKWLSLDNMILEKLFIRMAMGRPGVLSQLFDLDEGIQKTFLQAIQALQDQTSKQQQYSALTKIHKAGYLHIFLDAWIAQIAERDSAQVAHRLTVKRQLQTNVNVEKLLLSGILA